MTTWMQNTQKIVKNYFTKTNLAMFFVLFCLLIWRTPEDFFSPYLWAEDGAILIQGAIYDGLKGVIVPENGAYWILQKVLSLICYWLIAPFNNIEILPYIMQVLFKALAVLAILYFISVRFEWVVAEKNKRFLICCAIVLFLPKSSYDVLTCDTSLPFELFFVVFLLGLDLIFNRNEYFDITQTLFLAILALSSAAAPVIGVIAICVTGKYMYLIWRTKTVHKKRILKQISKFSIILIAVFIQTQMVLSSSRVTNDLEIVNRLILNTKSFIFFPYWQLFHSYVAFIIGLTIWVIIWVLTKFSWRIGLYSSGFSYLFMLYCSFVLPANEFYSGEMTGRYVFLNFEIAAFMIGIATLKLLAQPDSLRKLTGYAMTLCLSIAALKTYNIPVIGAEFADVYKEYSEMYRNNGTDQIRIAIGPWEPWSVVIPSDISNYAMKDDLEFEVEKINNVLIGTENFGSISIEDSTFEISGWARTSVQDQLFEKILVQNGNVYTPVLDVSIRDDFRGEQISHNGFRAELDLSYARDGMTTINLVGQTQDGVWHKGSIAIEFDIM